MKLPGLVCLAVFWFGGSTLGQPGDASLMLQSEASADDASAGSSGEPVTVILDAASRLTFRAETRGDDADVLVSHSGADVLILAPVSSELRLTFGVGGEVSYYDWGGALSIVPGGGEPFDDLYSVNVLAAARQTIDGPWALVVGGIGRAQFESGADFGDSMTGGGFVAAGYSFDERSWVDFGLGLFTRLEDDPVVVPYVNVRYALTDRVRLESRGLGLGIVASVTDEIEFSLKGEFEFRDFRLDDSRPAWRNGIVRDLRVPIGVELSWRPLPGFTIAVEGGAVVYQEYEFADDDGDEISDVETEPAAFIGLRLEYRF